jgi:hypothetical protein
MIRCLFQIGLIAAVTLILIELFFHTPPLPAWEKGERPKKLTPSQRRDSVTPGKRVGRG